jgi:hypothetical protein
MDLIRWGPLISDCVREQRVGQAGLIRLAWLGGGLRSREKEMTVMLAKLSTYTARGVKLNGFESSRGTSTRFGFVIEGANSNRRKS